MSDESDQQQEKQIKDYSEEVKRVIPALIEPAKADPSKVNNAISELLALEKKTRLAADAYSTNAIALAVLNLCHDTQKWDLLNENIALLCKRRAQLQKVVQQVIQTATAWIDSTPDDTIKRSLIGTLRTVSDGKMFVELERARMTRTLAKMEERDGNLAEAANVLQDIQVETIGSMDMHEKADFLLEQMRLFLAKQDWIRAEIVVKKIKPSVLDADDMQDLKLRYYEQMIQFHNHNDDYLSMSKAYQSVFNTPKVQESKELWHAALERTVMYLILAPFDSEVSDLLHRVKAEKKLDELAVPKAALDLFTTAELMSWPLPWDAEWRAHPVFADSVDGGKRLENLRKRAVQHNIRTIAGYYNRMRTQRLAELLALSADESEAAVSELVSSKQLFARIDRPAGVIRFKPTETADQALNNWGNGVNELLKLVDSTCHLINKEFMVHKVK